MDESDGPPIKAILKARARRSAEDLSGESFITETAIGYQRQLLASSDWPRAVNQCSTVTDASSCSERAFNPRRADQTFMSRLLSRRARRFSFRRPFARLSGCRMLGISNVVIPFTR